jgi:hypothetical protein
MKQKKCQLPVHDAYEREMCCCVRTLRMYLKMCVICRSALESAEPPGVKKDSKELNRTVPY